MPARLNRAMARTIIAAIFLALGAITLTGCSTGTPSTEATSTEAPSTEAASTEAPSTDVTTTETPSAETPSAEATSTEVPSTQTTLTDAPSTEATSTEVTSTPASITTIVSTERGSVSTSLKTVVRAGDSVLDVVNTAEFLVGDEIIIDKGLPVQETHTIKAISSIITNSPLQNDHQPGASVHLRVSTTTLRKTMTTIGLQATSTLGPSTTVASTPSPISTVTTTPALSPCDAFFSTVTTTPVLDLATPSTTAAVVVRLFDGRDAKQKEAQALTSSNAGLLVIGFACVAAVAVGVRSIKSCSSTRTFTTVDLEEGEALVLE